MEENKEKPNRIQKKLPSTAALIEEYKMVKNIAAMGLKYGLTGERIRQLMAKDKEAYKEAQKEIKKMFGFAPSAATLEKYPVFLQVVKEMGLIPGYRTMKKHMEISNHSYTCFRKKAESEGFVFKPYFEITKRQEATKLKMIEHLKELAERLGHTPCNTEINAEEKFWAEHYYVYFGSLTNAQKLAGLKPNSVGAQKGNRHWLNYVANKKQKEAKNDVNE